MLLVVAVETEVDSYREAGLADALKLARTIVTETSTVAVAAALSVTVQRKTALYVVPLTRLVPVKVVLAADALSAEIEADPLCRVHAYV